MQAELTEIKVTVLREGRRPLRCVSYGPYNTTCTPRDVFAVKQQMKLLPITCPNCGKTK